MFKPIGATRKLTWIARIHLHTAYINTVTTTVTTKKKKNNNNANAACNYYNRIPKPILVVADGFHTIMTVDVSNPS